MFGNFIDLYLWIYFFCILYYYKDSSLTPRHCWAHPCPLPPTSSGWKDRTSPRPKSPPFCPAQQTFIHKTSLYTRYGISPHNKLFYVHLLMQNKINPSKINVLSFFFQYVHIQNPHLFALHNKNTQLLINGNNFIRKWAQIS